MKGLKLQSVKLQAVVSSFISSQIPLLIYSLVYKILGPSWKYVCTPDFCWWIAKTPNTFICDHPKSTVAVAAPAYKLLNY